MNGTSFSFNAETVSSHQSAAHVSTKASADENAESWLRDCSNTGRWRGWLSFRRWTKRYDDCFATEDRWKGSLVSPFVGQAGLEMRSAPAKQLKGA
jgi:hypothetical protein